MPGNNSLLKVLRLLIARRRARLLLAIVGWCLGLAAGAQSLEPVILAGILAPTAPISPGSRVELSVIVQGEAPIFVFWFRNGELIEDIFDPVIALDPFDESMAGVYDAVAINEFGIAEAQSAVLVPDIPALPFTDAFDSRVGGQGAFPNRIVGREGSGRGSNVNATFQRPAGELEHGFFPGGRSVWVSWTADVTGIAGFSTEGSSFDTVLAVYRARDPQRPGLDSLVEVAANDDSDIASGTGLPPQPASLVLFNARAGTTYYIAVDGFGLADDFGPFLPELSESGEIVLSWAVEPTDQLIPAYLTELFDTNVDLGGPLTLDAKVEPTTANATEWQWWFDDQPLPGVTANQLNLSSVSRNQVGTYFCEARNVYGNDARRARTAEVDVQIAERSDGADKEIQAEDRFVAARRARLTAPGRGQAALAAGRPVDLKGLSAGSSGTQIFSTKGAGKESGEPVHCGIGGGRSKWFTIEARDDGLLVADTRGSDFDTVLAIYVDNGLGTGVFDGLVSVGCDNDAPGLGTSSRVAIRATKGTIYYLAVDGVREAVGIAQLNYTLQRAATITQQPVAQSVTAGATVLFKVVAVGTGTLKYQWLKGGQPVPGATLSEFKIASAVAGDAGSYSVEVTDDTSSVTSSVAALTVLSIAPMKLSLTRVSPTEILIRGTAAAGQVWQIESSRDLRLWETVATVTATAAGFESRRPASSLGGLQVFRAVRH